MLLELIQDGLDREAAAPALSHALRAQTPEAADGELAELAGLVSGFVRAIPAGIRALGATARDPRIGRGGALVAGQVLLYLLDDDDLLPESELGAAGLLDDAYLVHSAVATLRSASPGIDLGDGYEPPDARTVAVVRALLPAGVAEALDRTADALVRVAVSLFAVGADGSRPSTARPPAIRVSEAARLARAG